MKSNIKRFTLRTLFRIFSGLADWSGGGRIFVICKLIIGTLLLTPQLLEAQPRAAKKKQKQVDAKQQKATVSNDSADVYCYVTEQMPVYRGGEAAMLNFIYRCLNYSAEDMGNKAAGSVIVRFDVDKKGCIVAPSILRSLSTACDAEALRVVKLMPRWTPSSQNGVPVKVTYTLPVKFNKEAVPDDTVYIKTETAPEFPGGDAELFGYIAKNIRTNDIPFEMCYAGSMGGTIICRFIVEKDGALSHLQIIKSLDHEFDCLALDVIAQMPKWKPATRQGKAVRADYTLPVRVRLD